MNPEYTMGEAEAYRGALRGVQAMLREQPPVKAMSSVEYVAGYHEALRLIQAGVARMLANAKA